MGAAIAGLGNELMAPHAVVAVMESATMNPRGSVIISKPFSVQF